MTELKWIKHDGGPMPVPGDTVVRVKTKREGQEWPVELTAEDFKRGSNWWTENEGVQYGIIEYAIVTPSPTAPTPTGGGSSDYYKLTLPDGVTVECLDIAEALGLTPSEFNVFKACWRRGAARKGEAKAGYNSAYDADKMLFFSQRIVEAGANG